MERRGRRKGRKKEEKEGRKGGLRQVKRKKNDYIHTYIRVSLHRLEAEGWERVKMAMGESEGGRCLPLAVRFESGHGRAEARVESVKSQDPPFRVTGDFVEKSGLSRSGWGFVT